MVTRYTCHITLERGYFDDCRIMDSASRQCDCDRLGKHHQNGEGVMCRQLTTLWNNYGHLLAMANVLLWFVVACY